VHYITFISIVSRKEPGYKAEKTIIRIDSYTKYFKHMAAITSELIITMTDRATSTWITELALCTATQKIYKKQWLQFTRTQNISNIWQNLQVS
jgi:prenyltransferase beta subunit